MNDDSVFRRFEAFKFEDNVPFQTGWKAICKVIDHSKQDTEYLRAKAFFYSKNVEDFDFANYQHWKQKQYGANTLNDANSSTSSSCPLNGDSIRNQETENCEGDVPVSPSSRESHQTSCLQYKVERDADEQMQDKSTSAGIANQNSSCHHRETDLSLESDQSNLLTHSAENSQHNFSLADLAEMIQNNIPIPGIVPIHVEPTNSDPTPSMMSRKLKPWEKAEAGESNVCDISDLPLSDLTIHSEDSTALS